MYLKKEGNYNKNKRINYFNTNSKIIFNILKPRSKIYLKENYENKLIIF